MLVYLVSCSETYAGFSSKDSEAKREEACVSRSSYPAFDWIQRLSKDFKLALAGTAHHECLKNFKIPLQSYGEKSINLDLSERYMNYKGDTRIEDLVSPDGHVFLFRTITAPTPSQSTQLTQKLSPLCLNFLDGMQRLDLSNLKVVRAPQAHDCKISSLPDQLQKIHNLVQEKCHNPHHPKSCLEIVEDRYGVGSTILTSQLPTEDWFEHLGGAQVADAICDRLLHNCLKFTMVGDSMRKELAQEVLTKKERSDT